MRIGDAAAAAGTTPRALRLYEQRGLLPPPVRTPAGQREYGPDDVARVRVVRELLALGLTIEDVRACVDRLSLLDVEAIRSRRVPEGVCARTSPVVNRRIEALDEEIARLTRMRDGLASRAAAPRGGRNPEETTAPPGGVTA
ncbi:MULTISPECIES: MerR family transcriptional regulator [unclassified Streptomyces]|uniref:MerR family transcriptional regulator n=1 Tax=unclassified Streptomyces TaxID=2593676 RepID=UPI0006AFCDA2|nr:MULTISPECIES: MerR family transcriptional regulator [unclassified Streptomyces]KOX17939.1 MerR family transcriptional regulator [Streptomyces sp. NRRL F-6491]KOX36733.1 MerR family transcriptional regulator [Streptomyces sp. NRRL F-6492]